MSYQSDFVADPKGFMENHVVLQWVDGLLQSRPLVVTIKEQTNLKVVNKRGAKVLCMTDKVAGFGIKEKLPIHWIAYQQNATRQGVLNDRARYMFTAAMDGCTLGVGSQAGDGACLVTHANKGSAGKAGDYSGQRAAQREQLAGVFGGSDFTLMSPLQYKATSSGPLSFKATNFAVFEGKFWRFYIHRWMPTGGTSKINYIHGGVQVATMVSPAGEEALRF